MYSPISFFIVYTSIYFVLVPLYLYLTRSNDTYLMVVVIGFLSNLMLLIGYFTKLFFRFRIMPHVILNPRVFVDLSFTFFLMFAMYSFYTFGGVPLINIFLGDADPNLLRGQLFKGRQGIEIVLLYLSAIFSYVFIPLSVLLAFHYKMKMRYLFLAFALFFSIGTLQKALLLNILFPLFAYLLLKRKVGVKFFLIMFVILFSYFIFMIQSTGHAGSAIDSGGDFFSSTYVPSSALDYFFWRFFAVPIYTSVDTIYVFQNWMGGNHLLGSSSSLLSSLLGQERVDVEKIVFEYQFGGYNPLANANTYFAIGIFLDFSWVGLVVTSFFIGIFFQSMAQSKDLSIYSIGYLFAWQAANGSVIGIMLSSGFIYIVIHLFFLRYKFEGRYVT
ncbi:MAG: oligosaccharide repeat unit polymerase [Gammaproteobacteria bacterium]|nr:oligosaccharide repeat unit polymerase [Gammaproteobacteria bacterium]MBU2684455.1 oligosaccharide repeat unit polymerase [Gammaproteobacteria bacterium]